MKNRLLIAIIVAIVLAFASVFVFEGQMASVFWVGEFFLRSLKMIIVPLVMFSMVSGITALGDVRNLGRIGVRTLAFFGLTTLAAVALGTVLVAVLQPGAGLDVIAGAVPERVASKESIGFADIILGFVSNNIIESMAEMQLLPLIVFSLVLGGVLTTMGERGRPMAAFCESGNEAMMKIVHLVMLLAPVGIFGLVAGRFGKAVAEGGMDAFWAQLSAVGYYMFVVLLGLGIHGFIVLPLVLWATTRRNPLSYMRGMLPALLTAFSTASSSATLPVTLESVEEENGVDSRVANFVIPLGATVNMNGTALYEAVAVIFIAQALGIDLSFGQMLLVVITAALSAIGAAGIPEAGLVTMVIVLRAVDLPLAGVEMILAVDWLLDRFRTSINVWGDAVGAAVVAEAGGGAKLAPAHEHA
ncbi:MAG: dicarboxylate/amino acid:cation symporter [Deltaproteobacteria bacterium]|nr:dicarboxylate/amino acid:cation symporter [Deltaproteobacteria bacterium]